MTQVAAPRSPLVVHCEKAEFDVYIGRGTPWGNPFRQGPAQSRSQIIEAYRKWLMRQPDLVKRVRDELRGKRLGCHCRPKNCHGDILAEIANEETPGLTGGGP